MYFNLSISDTEPRYYADGEDAFAMRRELKEFQEKVFWKLGGFK